jgi:hypothetical protein
LGETGLDRIFPFGVIDDTERGRLGQQNNVARALLGLLDCRRKQMKMVFGSQSQGSAKQTYAATTAGKEAVS